MGLKPRAFWTFSIKNAYQINKSVFYEEQYKFPESSRKMYENN